MLAMSSVDSVFLADRASDKAVSSACRRPSSFLFACPKRKEPKRNDTPMARPPGILPCGYAGGWRGFPTALPCAGGKLAGIPAGHPADFPPPARRAIGTPGKAARSQRALFRRADAGAPRVVRRPAVASGAHDARLLFRGPWAAVRRGRQGRAAGIAREGDAFSTGQEPGRKARPRLTDSQGRMPGERQPGRPFLLATSLLGTQKRSSSTRGSGAKPLRRTRPDRRPAPPQAAHP